MLKIKLRKYTIRQNVLTFQTYKTLLPLLATCVSGEILVNIDCCVFLCSFMPI